jgi:hypothetical protein
MQQRLSIFFVSFFLILFSLSGFAQVLGDSTVTTTKDSIALPGNQAMFSADTSKLKSSTVKSKDTTDLLWKSSGIPTGKKAFNPRTATIRSALIPGWGQAYNKQYWKIPLIYAALGTTGYIFVYNIKNYNLFKNAYKQSVIDGGIDNDPNIDPSVRLYSQASLLANRNVFRQNIDYSVLFFLLFWGLNVVDATVSAHLRTFDVSDDISLELNPGHSDIANTDGLSFVMKIGKRH